MFDFLKGLRKKEKKEQKDEVNTPQKTAEKEVPKQMEKMQTEKAREGFTKVKKREQNIAAIMEKTGWSREETLKQLKIAKEEVGCGSYVYAYYGFYNMTKEEQIETYKKWQKKQARKERNRDKKLQKCLDVTLAATDWTAEYALEQIEETMERTGCTAEEYREYRFWSLTPAEQEKFFLMCHTDIIRRKYSVDLNLSRLIKDKNEANVYFAKYIDRRWCSNRGTTFEEFSATFRECSKLFYKPVSSCGGSGARPFDISAETMRSVYEQIMELPEGVVEEFVVQHPQLSAMSPNVLNTIRLTSISYNGPIDAAGNRFVIPYAMLKMGGAKGYVDNLKQGGVGAAIDLETGKLCTDAVDVDLNTYTHHPVTGMQIQGFQVPYFEEAKAMIRRIVEENSMRGYLAWDVAITERGPMLIEINGRPSSTLLELPFYNTPLRGRKSVMEKYM